MPTIFVAVGTLPPSLVELPRTWSLCPPYESIAHFHLLATRFRPSDANSLPPSKIEGAGNAGCALHLRSRVPKCVKKAHTSIQVSGGSPTSPAQWLYGLLRALPGERAFFATVIPEKLASQELSASVAAPGPHDFAVRLGVFVRR